eukprot:15247790-Ditylum_brightwellii.AAC.1
MTTKYINQKAFTLSLVPTNSATGLGIEAYKVNYMTEDGHRTLWHQKLYHTHNVSNLHHYVDGIPKIKNHNIIDKCNICLSYKMYKMTKGKGDICKGTDTTGQGISLDQGVMVQQLKNQERG